MLYLKRVSNADIPRKKGLTLGEMPSSSLIRTDKGEGEKSVERERTFEVFSAGKRRFGRSDLSYLTLVVIFRKRGKLPWAATNNHLKGSLLF